MEAGEEIYEIDLQGIEDCDQLDGIDAASPGLDLGHPGLNPIETLGEDGLRDALLVADGGQQLDEDGVVIAAC
jgi:hypothetical protein